MNNKSLEIIDGSTERELLKRFRKAFYEEEDDKELKIVSKDIKNYLSLCPDNLTVKFALVKILKHFENFTEAIEILKGLPGDHPIYQIEIGDCLILKGEFEEAKKHLYSAKEKAKFKAFIGSEFYSNLILYELFYYELKNKKKAWNYIKECQKLIPYDYRGFYYLLEFLEKENIFNLNEIGNELKKAYEIYQEFFSSQTQLLIKIANLYFKTNNFSKAEDILGQGLIKSDQKTLNLFLNISIDLMKTYQKTKKTIKIYETIGFVSTKIENLIEPFGESKTYDNLTLLFFLYNAIGFLKKYHPKNKEQINTLQNKLIIECQKNKELTILGKDYTEYFERKWGKDNYFC